MDIPVTILMLPRVRKASNEKRAYFTDVHSVRTTRARIIYLKNDYKDLMNRIEKGLHQHHATLRESGDSKDVQSPATGGTVEQNAPASSRTTLDPPFARVNSVAPSSPAHEAGLKVGDKIRNFGAVHSRNHENLRRVAEVVQRQEGVCHYPSIHII